FTTIYFLSLVERVNVKLWDSRMPAELTFGVGAPDASSTEDIGSRGIRSARGLLALGLLDDLFSHSLGNLGVAVEGHRVHGATRGLRTQVTDVTEHLRQRNQSADDLDARGIF